MRRSKEKRGGGRGGKELHREFAESKHITMAKRLTTSYAILYFIHVKSK